MDYSELILAIRAKLDLTQQQLADKLNVNFATINRWENGKRVPSKRYVYLLEELCVENNIDFKKGGKNEKI